ncbi:hypothetical protein [Nocardia sp.]|uniref:hypothetical protein n=1 Tax=Nocardia sp. TaxID=1821 RepID=UPI0026097B6A|nr:hypothetical protein [Nocardia sp.]
MASIICRSLIGSERNLVDAPEIIGPVEHPVRESGVAVAIGDLGGGVRVIAEGTELPVADAPDLSGHMGGDEWITGAVQFEPVRHGERVDQVRADPLLRVLRIGDRYPVEHGLHPGFDRVDVPSVGRNLDSVRLFHSGSLWIDHAVRRHRPIPVPMYFVV